MVRNEDLFIGQAITNVIEFCDTIIVANHKSTDETADVVSGIVRSHNKVQLVNIAEPGESQALVDKYVGTRTWVFGVDGDELYDPIGLAILRETICSGAFQKYYRVYGNVLHCTSISNTSAAGYLAPPSRTMTKLFNFDAYECWNGPFDERLHGGNPSYRKQYASRPVLALHDDCAWTDSPLRCLHTCFLPRSSEDRGEKIRLNIMEKKEITTSLKQAIRYFTRRAFGDTQHYKLRKYMRGQVVTVDATTFFSRSV